MSWKKRKNKEKIVNIFKNNAKLDLYRSLRVAIG